MVRRISTQRMITFKYEQAFSIIHMQVINRICTRFHKAKLIYELLVNMAKKFHLSTSDLFFLGLVLKRLQGIQSMKLKNCIAVSAWIIKSLTSSHSFHYLDILRKMVKCMNLSIFHWLLNCTVHLRLNIYSLPDIENIAKDYGVSLSSIRKFEFDLNQFIRDLAQKFARKAMEEAFQFSSLKV
ncbi:unnamed protein product [Blepharisma stoltei]|uniref:Uncharacterized protein n=1 Tax=Blepharisma stoltei TaxID=1481888 RepID=A0AAU9J3E5_9CILI|nr:unnamed protein product [Blepharisma stoltei]